MQRPRKAAVKKAQAEQAYYDTMNARRRQLKIIEKLENRLNAYNVSEKESISLSKQIAMEYNKLYKINQQQIKIQFELMEA